MAEPTHAGSLVRGLALGFSIAAPVGPIGLLCIRRTLADGRAVGLAAGLGAATADAVYGAVAALGLGVVSGFLVRQQSWLQAVGGTFLIWLGLQSFRSALPEREASVAAGNGLGAFASTFGLTLSNPMTILSFAALFTATGPAADGGRTGALLLVGGVFLGSAAWWLTLTSAVAFWRTRVSARTMLWINRAAGSFLALWGLRILVALVRSRLQAT